MRNLVLNTFLTLIGTVAALTLSGCQQTEQTAAQNETVVFQLTPSTAGVGEFLRQFKGYETTYDQDICYNITPKDITDRYDFCIFKYDTSCGSFLSYDKEVYPLGIWFGSRVNVKATTEERLGFTGTGEGMACHAVCLLEE